MNSLQQRLMTAARPMLLMMFAAVIHELTIKGRYLYDRADALGGMRNERSDPSRLRDSGYLRDLIDPIEPLTASRTDSIATASEVLPQGAINRIFGFAA